MHFEFLVEDQSTKEALQILLPKILEQRHTFKINPYRGVGHLPKDLRPRTDASKRILLDQLPRLLKGYGKQFRNYSAIIVVLCDLDDRDRESFAHELRGAYEACDPKPEAEFYFAIEETEAWYLGDLTAILQAYPNAKETILATYVNDAICGTWEILANAVHEGGCQALSVKGRQTEGAEKTKWARKICPFMKIDRNNSPSFNEFCSGLRSHA
ncbi:MAG: DUF4276 family protein [Coriobacteriales bacterium]|jgi:hypothetical protein|nr:DUF4276 family protein [Coriobacteriales bacterium]